MEPVTRSSDLERLLATALGRAAECGARTTAWLSCCRFLRWLGPEMLPLETDCAFAAPTNPAKNAVRNAIRATLSISFSPGRMLRQVNPNWTFAHLPVISLNLY